MGLPRSFPIACALFSAAMAQPQSGPNGSPGNALVATGKIMAYGGLGLAVFGYFPAPRVAGLVAFGLGVPLTGLGAGMVNRSAQALDSGYHPDSRGWGWNLSGTALAALGMQGITAGVHDKDPGSIFGGAILFLAGMGCDGVALVKFSDYAEEGRAVLSRPNRVSVEPLWLDPRGRTSPGLRMSYRF